MIINSKIILIPIGLVLAYFAFAWFVCKVSDFALKQSLQKDRKVKA